ncbi:hypothetical protein V5799_005389 [Amblyomma americanum]|uniref:Uncharacterized protein n=1 Tax=Amblyomma americanum TaxID=6943 RepID=A0AAQ4DZD9_AMBAM
MKKGTEAVSKPAPPYLAAVSADDSAPPANTPSSPCETSGTCWLGQGGLLGHGRSWAGAPRAPSCRCCHAEFANERLVSDHWKCKHPSSCLTAPTPKLPWTKKEME